MSENNAKTLIACISLFNMKYVTRCNEAYFVHCLKTNDKIGKLLSPDSIYTDVECAEKASVVVVCSPHDLIVSDINTLQVLQAIHRDAIVKVAISCSGNMIAFYEYDSVEYKTNCKLFVCDVKKSFLQPIETPFSQEIGYTMRALGVSDKTLLCSYDAYDDYQVCVGDIQSGKISPVDYLHSFANIGSQICVSPDENFAMFYGMSGARLFDLRKKTTELVDFGYCLRLFTFSNCQKYYCLTEMDELTYCLGEINQSAFQCAGSSVTSTQTTLHVVDVNRIQTTRVIRLDKKVEQVLFSQSASIIYYACRNVVGQVDLLLKKRFVPLAFILLKKQICPYVIVEIINLIIGWENSVSMENETEFCHYEKMKLVTELWVFTTFQCQ